MKLKTKSSRSDKNPPSGGFLKAIHYARVSRPGLTASESVLSQFRITRAWSSKLGFADVSYFEDDASAMPDKTHKRDGFVGAVKSAIEHKGAIFVTTIDRLTRSVSDITNIILKHEIPVFVKALGRQATPDELLRGAKAAHRAGQKIRDATSSSLQEKINNGVKLGPPGDLAVRGQRGAVNNILRAEDTAREIAAVLRTYDGLPAPSDRVLAERLNACGIMTRSRKPWTAKNVNRPRARAERQLADEQEESLDWASGSDIVMLAS